MGYWAKAPWGRDQVLLFSPTLDAMISGDHPVRLFEEILLKVDWTPWEAKYDGRRGQPPIHARIVAGVLLYGLTRGLRSSRTLEYLIGNNLDFMWLGEGRQIDHSTLCAFRKEFREPLNLAKLVREVARLRQVRYVGGNGGSLGKPGEGLRPGTVPIFVAGGHKNGAVPLGETG
jgi:transposase